MATLAYNWNINREKYVQRIQFQDSMNLLPKSLATVGKTFNCEMQKLECDHNAIFLDNWESEVVR